jgi:hypothetical protein
MDKRIILNDLGKCDVKKQKPVVINVGDIKDVDIICSKPAKIDSYTRLHNESQINSAIFEEK